MKVFCFILIVLTLPAFAQPCVEPLAADHLNAASAAAQSLGGHDHNESSPHECEPPCDCETQIEFASKSSFRCGPVSATGLSAQRAITDYLDPATSRHKNPVWQPPEPII